jgi:hypothetical protein
MAPPPASPIRIVAAAGAPPPPPPPPTYRGHFQFLRDQTPDPSAQKRVLWDFSLAVVDFLLAEFVPRVGYGDPDARAVVNAETDLKFSMSSGAQGQFVSSKNYAEAFAYVQTGEADALVDRVLDMYAGGVSMPDPRVDVNDFADWSAMHPISYGARRRRPTRRARRRGKRTYRHSPRKR